MEKPFSKDPVVEKSLHHSIKDGVGFSLMVGMCENYFSAFAVFLKASAQQVGLLASLPPVLAAFAQIFAVWLGHKTGTRKSIIVAGALLQVTALVFVASMPALFPSWSFPLLLASVILYFVGPNLGAPLWGSLMGAIVPESVRGRFFARRTRLSSIASFSGLILAGLILQLFDYFDLTIFGFFAIFALGMVARLFSAYHLHQKHDPKVMIEDDRDRLVSPWYLRQHPNFLKFSMFFVFMQFAVAISGPFVVVYLLRDLHFSYLELTLNTSASVLVQFIVLSRWGRLGDLFGNRIILRVTGFTIPFIPLLWILSTDYVYLILVQAISGLVWSGYSLSASNFLFDLTPANRRGGMMAMHNLLASIGVFLGASLGSYLTVVMPRDLDIQVGSWEWHSVFYWLFLASALTRLVVAFVFLPMLEEVRRFRRMSYHGLIFRATRFSPVSGVIFDIVTSTRGAFRRDSGE